MENGKFDENKACTYRLHAPKCLTIAPTDQADNSECHVTNQHREELLRHDHYMFTQLVHHSCLLLTKIELGLHSLLGRETAPRL